MATFEVKAYKLAIEPHPDADALELAIIGDYRSIVRKGQFKTGDVAVYIPEAAVLPDWLIEKLGLVGKLAGPNKNRVKAVKLRGVLSQGLVYPTCRYYDELAVEFIQTDKQYLCETELPHGQGYRYAPVEPGFDYAGLLGITKWEPPIPIHMAGEVFNAFGLTLKYDIENIKKYPTVIADGEHVVMTEKLHGTWTCLGYHPEAKETNGYIVTSKGLSQGGLAFKMNEANANNLYVRSLQSTKTITDRGIEEDIVERMMYVIDSAATPFYILGETFGAGVQDLHYGTTQPQFRVFDIYLGEPGNGGRYLDFEELVDFCRRLEVDLVPVLYKGPFNKTALDQATNGNETFSGSESHMREGVIVKPLIERYDPTIGRVQLKSISEAYLLRKNKNATEYT